MDETGLFTSHRKQFVRSPEKDIKISKTAYQLCYARI